VYEISTCFPTTLENTIVGLSVAIILGIPSGIASALKRQKIIDHLLRVFSLGIYSVPTYVLGMFLQLLIAVYLGWLPVTGRSSYAVFHSHITGLYVLDDLLTLNFIGLLDSFGYLALPGLTLGLGLMPLISRIGRASIIETLNEDYVTTARAEGFPESQVIYKHALPNALLPIITVVGMSFAGLLGGSVLTETIFSLPGLGRLFMTSLYNRDFPLIQGVVVVYSLIVVTSNTLIDILYGILDPRIRY